MSDRYTFLSTYPPTRCGLATFTATLAQSMTDSGEVESRVVRLVETTQGEPDSQVAGELVAGDPASMVEAIALLNDSDVAVVQHEYGVFGGPDGDEAVQLLSGLSTPVIVVLHTVLSEPTPHQRTVLEEVTQHADAIVTMSTTAHDRLRLYNVDMDKVHVIPHGAPEFHPITRVAGGPPTVLTWGLIGPGKGIEWAIAAMALLKDLDPAVRYIVAGETHPKVVLHEGEAYRERLQSLARDLGVEKSVIFENRYRNAEELAALVAHADVVLLPYDSVEQVTSGVLIEAVGAHLPVVATRFPHAVELLGDGAGIVVDHAAPLAIASALRTVLTEPDTDDRMRAAAARAAANLAWSAVGDRYRSLGSSLIAARHLT